MYIFSSVVFIISHNFVPLLLLTLSCNLQAAWGGAALVSNKHRHLLRGIERYNNNKLYSNQNYYHN